MSQNLLFAYRIPVKLKSILAFWCPVYLNRRKSYSNEWRKEKEKGDDKKKETIISRHHRE